MECEECDGTGLVDCTCRDCGDEHEYECPNCEGTGQIDDEENEDD